MKNFCIAILFFFSPFFSNAQVVSVSGKCITGTITMTTLFNMDGKPVFQGVGKVLGYSNITVSIYWLGSENVWVIDFEGQPYFMNTCNTSLPPATAGSSCLWVPVEGTDCFGSALVVSGSSTLPVKFLNFKGQVEDQKVLLDWKTAFEMNNEGFEIYRSKDGLNWNRIGIVNPEINSSLETNYNFTDEDPLQGSNFYRISQKDIDGNNSFSDIIKVDFSKKGFYTLGNNPGNGIYQLNIKSANRTTIMVSDMSGRQLMNKQINPGIQQLDISRFTKGTYLLRLKIGNNVFTEKLIRQ